MRAGKGITSNASYKLEGVGSSLPARHNFILLQQGYAAQIDLREGRRRMVGHSVMSTKVQERTTFQRRSYQRSPDFWSGPKNADTKTQTLQFRKLGSKMEAMSPEMRLFLLPGSTLLNLFFQRLWFIRLG